MRLIRALDPSDIRRRQQSGNEHPSHLIIGGHGLPSSRSLPPNIQSAPGSHGLSGAPQYPSSHYDVKVEEDYMVGTTRGFFFPPRWATSKADCVPVTDAGIVSQLDLLTYPLV